MEKILERLKKLGKQILEWWKKFGRKQQIVIVGSTLVVIIALVVLVNVLTKTKYTFLITAETSAEGAEVSEILQEAGVDYKVSDDGRTFRVAKGQESDANLALGSKGFETSDYADLKSLLSSGGFSTTESDKQKLYHKNLEVQIKNDLKSFDFVKDATVNLEIPEDNGTLIYQNMDSSAAIILTLRGRSDMTTDTARAIAQFVATALGTESTERITIMDSEGNLYFAGANESTLSGAATNQLTISRQTDSLAEAAVLNALVGLKEFSSVTVSPHMVVDFTSGEDATHKYESQDGTKESVYADKTEYSAESTSGDGGVPGTTSNTSDSPTYVFQSNNEQSSTEIENQYHFLPNESTSYRSIPPGIVNTADSSIAVTTVTYNKIYEKNARRQGLLEDMTWEEYKLANDNVRTKMEVDEDWIATVSAATGVPKENISFVSYLENWCVDAEKSSVKMTDVVTIALIVLIIGLLAFVLLRSMRESKQQEQEEELSVETLLQSTPEIPPEDIELEEKSNARKSIEKFVDENPDAVANLLRNWLSEDWG